MLDVKGLAVVEAACTDFLTGALMLLPQSEWLLRLVRVWSTGIHNFFSICPIK